MNTPSSGIPIETTVIPSPGEKLLAHLKKKIRTPEGHEASINRAEETWSDGSTYDVSCTCGLILRWCKPTKSTGYFGQGVATRWNRHVEVEIEDEQAATILVAEAKSARHTYKIMVAHYTMNPDDSDGSDGGFWRWGVWKLTTKGWKQIGWSKTRREAIPNAVKRTRQLEREGKEVTWYQTNDPVGTVVPYGSIQSAIEHYTIKAGRAKNIKELAEVREELVEAHGLVALLQGLIDDIDAKLKKEFSI